MDSTTALVKRYALSSFITFSSMFLTVLALNINNLTAGTFSFATVASLVLLAGRAGMKAVIEAVAGGHADLPSITATKVPQIVPVSSYINGVPQIVPVSSYINSSTADVTLVSPTV